MERGRAGGPAMGVAEKSREGGRGGRNAGVATWRRRGGGIAATVQPTVRRRARERSARPQERRARLGASLGACPR